MSSQILIFKVLINSNVKYNKVNTVYLVKISHKHNAVIIIIILKFVNQFIVLTGNLLNIFKILFFNNLLLLVINKIVHRVMIKF